MPSAQPLTDRALAAPGPGSQSVSLGCEGFIWFLLFFFWLYGGARRPKEFEEVAKLALVFSWLQHIFELLLLLFFLGGGI